MPVYPEHWDPEPPDPMVDESITLRCVDLACPEYWLTYHPTTTFEYQGEHPHGGMVEIYTDEAFDCPECGQPGEEVSD